MVAIDSLRSPVLSFLAFIHLLNLIQYSAIRWLSVKWNYCTYFINISCKNTKISWSKENIVHYWRWSDKVSTTNYLELLTNFVYSELLSFETPILYTSIQFYSILGLAEQVQWKGLADPQLSVRLIFLWLYLKSVYYSKHTLETWLFWLFFTVWSITGWIFD